MSDGPSRPGRTRTVTHSVSWLSGCLVVLTSWRLTAGGWRRALWFGKHFCFASAKLCNISNTNFARQRLINLCQSNFQRSLRRHETESPTALAPVHASPCPCPCPCSAPAASQIDCQSFKDIFSYFAGRQLKDIGF